MTAGQIAQLQELSKCNIVESDKGTLSWFLAWGLESEKLLPFEKAWLRRLTHQYRHQIKAMKRNRKDLK